MLAAELPEANGSHLSMRCGRKAGTGVKGLGKQPARPGNLRRFVTKLSIRELLSRGVLYGTIYARSPTRLGLAISLVGRR